MDPQIKVLTVDRKIGIGIISNKSSQEKFGKIDEIFTDPRGLAPTYLKITKTHIGAQCLIFLITFLTEHRIIRNPPPPLSKFLSRE